MLKLESSHFLQLKEIVKMIYWLLISGTICNTYNTVSMLRNMPNAVTKKQNPSHQFNVLEYSVLDMVALNRPTKLDTPIRAANNAPTNI